MTIAVDFDGTIVEHRYPQIGEEIPFAYTESIFIPASCEDVEIVGNTRVLISYVK